MRSAEALSFPQKTIRTKFCVLHRMRPEAIWLLADKLMPPWHSVRAYQLILKAAQQTFEATPS